MPQSEIKWIYDLCHSCFDIAWVDRDSGPHSCTKMKKSVWSETEIDFVAALREISHLPHVFAPFRRRSAQPTVDFSQFTSSEPCRNCWQKEEFHIRVWIDDVEIPSANINALHLGSLQKRHLFPARPSKILPYDEDKRWCFESFTAKYCCCKLMTCWRKITRPYLCKKVLPKFLEFILNLVKLVIWQPWRNAEADRMFLCNELLSKFVETGHFQPGPAK